MRPLLLALALASSPALAGPCIKNDAWTGPDKTKHLIAGAALGAAGTLAFQNAQTGLLLGAGVGLAKELVDRRGSGTCSLQDFAVTVAGAAAGAYGAKVVILPLLNARGRADGVMVAWSVKL